ncbi:MAG: T9SS type A sorting domain-containing protein [Bacteroidetes bacterium]|nr:T9SS type A sorting domain-containing protein [Bacteroidota bacterium]
MIKKILLASFLFLLSFKVTQAQYCLPVFSIGCTSADFIDNFSTTGGITNISNLASGCNGTVPNSYVFNNTMTVSQTQGLSFNFTVQAGATWSQGFGIWVDWNQDYDFDETNEFVYFSPSSATTPFNGIITIPPTAPPGITRMRVICRFVTVPTNIEYCGTNFSFGECEDYNLEVLPSAPCVGMPMAGTVTPPGPLTQCAGQAVNLGLTGNTVTGNLTYNWQQSTTSAAGPWINVIGGFGGTGPGYATPGLTGTTWYQCTVTCANSGLSSSTPPYVINVVAPTYATVPYTQDFETWMSYCDVQDVPNDLHWSNNPLTGDASWRRDDEGYTANWLNSTSGFYSPAGSVNLHSARFHSYGTNVSGDLDLYLNCGVLPGDKTITFDYINNNFTGFGFDSLEVLLSTNAGFSYTPIGSYTNSPSWQSNALIIPSNSSTTLIRFRGRGDFQYDTDLGIDNINVLAPCNGMPNAGIINPMTPCAGIPFTLSLSGATVAGGITYTWQSGPSSTGPWTTLGITAGPTFTTTVASATYFQCIVTCPNGAGFIATTPTMYAQMASFYTCYCLSQSETNFEEQNIGNVSLFNSQNVAILNNGTATPLLNNPSVLNYYTDFSSLTPPTIYRDSVYDAKVTAFTKIGFFYNGYSKIYIDYNRDGVFDPVTENVGGGVLNSGTQLMASNFTVPATAQFGVTGMRVVYRVFGTSTTVTPCGTYPSGETEDYLINISLPPCNTPPNAGNATISDTISCPGYTLFMEDTGHDVIYLGLSFNWQYSNDGINYTDIPGATLDTLSYVVNNESWFRFRTTCNGVSNAYSDTLHVTMSPPSSCYGQSASFGGSLDSSDIGAVIIADSFSNNNIYSYITGGPHLNNPMAIKNRTDRTMFGPMALMTDSTYKLAVYHIMRTPTHADARVTVFIDYNNNQVYDIPQERVFTGLADISNYYLYTYIHTPLFPAINTPTGLRVVLNNNVSPNTASDTGVGLYTSGETEDYLVSFQFKQLPSSIHDVYAIDQIAVYPNPTSGKVYVGLNAIEMTNLNISILNITGTVLDQKQFDKIQGEFVTELNLTNYAKGTYLIKINSDKGNFVRRVVVE